MFESDTAIQTITDLAEQAADTDGEISVLEAQVKELRKKSENLKETLSTIMLSNGFESVKLDNGLTPKAVTQYKVSKRPDVEDTVMFAWLRDHDMGDIIKPTAHWSTLQSTMNDFIAAGGELPEDIMKQSERKTVKLYGKSRYLNNRG